MVQTAFKVKNEDISDDIINRLHDLLKKQFREIINEVTDKIRLQEIVRGHPEKPLKREDLRHNTRPEDTTEDYIIAPVLEYLGYQKGKSYFKRTGPESDKRTQECDFTLLVGNEKILVESEPLGKDLYKTGVGVRQLANYLDIRSFKAEVGIATNGLRWILVKYNPERFGIDIINEVDLSPIFYEVLQIKPLDDVSSILEEFYRTFSRQFILQAAKELEINLNIAKENVSKKFYQDYVKYVFGVDPTGKPSYCLLDGLIPNGLSDEVKREFAVTLMNRLMFIKFLEDRALPRSTLLKDLLDSYNRLKGQGSPLNFYDTYLKTLFYEVFNTSRNKRKPAVNSSQFFADLPYLNGGLFRENIPGESSISVADDIMVRILEELMLGYNFSIVSQNVSEYSAGKGDVLDPDILGYVFEKTINFLTASGNNRQKMEGAYYTPERITQHMSEKAIFHKLLEKIREGLRDSGWTESDISRLRNMGDFAEMGGMSEATARKLLERIDELKVLDPACGSGHFLTAALKLIVYTRKIVLAKAGMSVDTYELKRRTITLNLYGVDLERPAVEIAKLRLWLSLIEELDSENINSVKTLPNIEYNIVTGDSLIGLCSEELTQVSFSEIKSERLAGVFDGLEIYLAEDHTGLSRLERAKDQLFKEFPTLDEVKDAYHNLKQMYAVEQGERAVMLKRMLETIREKIYEHIAPLFSKYIDSNYPGVFRSARIRNSDIVRNSFHWTIDFVEAFDSGGFDVVIGNPPYGFKFQKTERDYLRAKFKSSSENGNSAMMFIERGLELLKDDGYLCFIVPKSLSYAQVWKSGRELLARDLNWAIDVSKAFKDVKLEQMIIGVIKGSSTDTYVVERIDSQSVLTLEKDLFSRTDTILFSGSRDEIGILRKMSQSGKFFRDISRTRRGLPLQSQLTQVKDGFPVIRGKNISSYRIRKPDEYLPENIVASLDGSVIEFLRVARVVSQRIVAHVQNPVPHLVIMSAVKPEGLLSVDTVENTVVTDRRYSPYFLVALLNSKVVAWYCYRFIFSNAIRSMDLDDYYIGKIPLPSINKMVMEINQFIERNPDIFDSYSQVEITDRKLVEKTAELETLICKAYGLSDKEIEIVKNET